MAVRNIVIHFDNRKLLRRKSRRVRVVNRRVRRLIRNLKDTLNYHSNGIGLAAPQIGVLKRVVVVRLGGRKDSEGEPDPPIALINPEILEAGFEKADFDGCLSLPGLYAQTIRPHLLRVVGLDEDGHPFDRVFEDFDAVVVHHEIDHLNGVLFIDRVRHIRDLYRVRQDESGEFVCVSIVDGNRYRKAVETLDTETALL